MHAYTRLGAATVPAIFVILGALAVSGCGNASGPRDTLQPTPSDRISDSASPAAPTAITIPAMSETFRSAFHGYTIRYPAGWIVTLASKPWVGAALLWGDPAQDDLRGAEIRLVAASQPLAQDETAEAWLAKWSGGPPCTGASLLPQHVPVGSSTGTVTLNGCAADGGLVAHGVVYDVVVVVESRGYDFTVDGNVDAGFVQALLGTVTFEPERATGAR